MLQQFELKFATVVPGVVHGGLADSGIECVDGCAPVESASEVGDVKRERAKERTGDRERERKRGQEREPARQIRANKVIEFHDGAVGDKTQNTNTNSEENGSRQDRHG